MSKLVLNNLNQYVYETDIVYHGSFNGNYRDFCSRRKTDIVDQLLHEQAVKALEDKKFVIKFNAKHYDRNNRVKYYDDRYCFLEIGFQ